MRIILASDHGGYELKGNIKTYLDTTEHTYTD